MISGADLVAQALQVFRTGGIHYDQCWSRCTPELWPHCVDCSGLTSHCLNVLGLNEGCTGSFQQAREAHARGHALTFDEALWTPGAFLWVGINEGQGGIPGVDEGHVGLSAGDGVHSLEARGHWAGVGVFIARSIVWDWQGLMPGVNVPSGPPTAPTPISLPPLAVQEDETMGMVPLPNTNATPNGREASARAIKAFNFVLLEDGGRVWGDMPVDPANPNGPHHWWAPAPQNHGGPLPPAAQIVDVMLSRDSKHLVARYGFPNGDSGTYATPIVGA